MGAGGVLKGRDTCSKTEAVTPVRHSLQARIAVQLRVPFNRNLIPMAQPCQSFWKSSGQTRRLDRLMRPSFLVMTLGTASYRETDCGCLGTEM